MAPDLGGGTAVNSVRALLESRSHPPKHLVEHSAGQEREGAAAEFVVDEEFDVAGVFARRMEDPLVVHAAERPVEILDLNGKIVPVENGAAGEALVYELIGDRHHRDQHAFAVGTDSVAAHAHVAAQGYKFRIALYVGHQIEHLGRGVADEPPGPKFWQSGRSSEPQEFEQIGSKWPAARAALDLAKAIAAVRFLQA